MNNFFRKAFIVGKAIFLPVVVFFVGVFIMRTISGHDYVKRQLSQKAAPEHQKPLNMRFFGYGVEAVDQHWGVFDNRAFQSEQRFLQADLVFPLFYGAAFIVPLWGLWSRLGKPFSVIWLIAPVAVTLVADWTENLVQLAQLRLYMERERAGLEPGCIQIASAATTIKLLFFIGTLLFLVCLAVRTVKQQASPSSKDPINMERE